jgi:hypothetical protein
MKVRFSGSLAVFSLLLLTCASCQLSDYDSDGDGIVTRQEFVSALLDSVCDDQVEPQPEEPPADGDDEEEVVSPAP